MDHLEFILLDISAPLIEEWQLALKKHLPKDIQAKFTIIQSNISALPPPYDQFDCIVSPANSYGRLDGGWVEHAVNRWPQLIDKIE